jgi:hypothetical protein
MRCCHCHFLRGTGENMFMEQHLLERYLLNVFFKIAKRLLGGHGEICCEICLLYVFSVSVWQMSARTAHQSLIFEVQKLVEVPI